MWEKYFYRNNPEPKAENLFVQGESCDHSMNCTRTPLRKRNKDMLLSADATQSFSSGSSGDFHRKVGSFLGLWKMWRGFHFIRKPWLLLSCWPLPGLCICLTAHQTVEWGESSLWKGCYCDNAKEAYSIYSIHWRWVWRAVVMREGGKLTGVTEEQVDGCFVNRFRPSTTFRKFQ